MPYAATALRTRSFTRNLNHAWQTYHGRARREEIAHRMAWSAVKRKYVKVGDPLAGRMGLNRSIAQ
jgi:cation transport regulator ChaB